LEWLIGLIRRIEWMVERVRPARLDILEMARSSGCLCSEHRDPRASRKIDWISRCRQN